MKSRTLAIALVAASVSLAPIASTPATAQPQQQQRPSSMSSAVATGLPIALWAITGGVLGAVVWPMVSSGTLVFTPIDSVGALMNSGAAVGTVIGGVGYYMTR
jgi:uncharacterized membrane protein